MVDYKQGFRLWLKGFGEGMVFVLPAMIVTMLLMKEIKKLTTYGLINLYIVLIIFFFASMAFYAVSRDNNKGDDE